MDVAQLLDAFALAPYIEVVVAGLPENGGGAKAPRLFCGLRVPKGPLFHGVSSIQHFQVAELCSAGQPRAAVPTWFVLVDAFARASRPRPHGLGCPSHFFLRPISLTSFLDCAITEYGVTYREHHELILALFSIRYATHTNLQVQPSCEHDRTIQMRHQATAQLKIRSLVTASGLGSFRRRRFCTKPSGWVFG